VLLGPLEAQPPPASACLLALGPFLFWGDCLPAPAALQWRMAISTNREKTLEECKRHIDECAALLERTSVPEYREAIIAMGKAWMKIAEQAKQVGD